MDFTEWKGVPVLNNWKNIQKAKDIEKKNREKILAVNPKVDNGSGIYFLTRIDEDGFRYVYVGQAVHLLSRLAGHLNGYQHIDLSLKKHGLYSEDNPYGWKIDFIYYSVSELDIREQYWIKHYAEEGYQLRNKTSGSQGGGKRQIDDFRPGKTYRDGLRQGYINASREICHLFDLHLNVSTKKEPPTVNQEKAMEKFENFFLAHKK